MKKTYLMIFLMMMLVMAGAGCSSDETEMKPQAGGKVELTVSAAVSLQDALNDIKKSFEKENANVEVHYNFGASGALQQQISQGAPVDLFFSAAEDKFDKLIEEDLIEEKNGIDLVGNDLVLVVPKDSKKEIGSLEDLTKADKISIGTPESVPAGQYAKQTLEKLNLWKEIEGKLVYAKDVRQVLTYVETGNVDAGLVYKTDALSSEKVEIVAVADKDLHDPIIYPVGMIKDSSHPKEAQLFYDYLQSEDSIKVFEKYGFEDLN
ncbi:molybdate ABC transporter substrate-binding protein [Peribacillus frigoritolerans]|uniref:molybdate ABC transporter substrate-binding protein n=1 Tax=Peribacillus frigoritolerans TaxID=450367 RepID=UPI002E240A2C|nr:molybdate ABC transporter substrate-binding protein [Peribacillus frigoritolerans]MED3786077.1 molybdate ABC transporter substrate-binding protein [Peribacillus frigoritolerans]